MKKLFYYLLPLCMLFACTKEEETGPVLTIDDDFEQDNNGWVTGFADYRVGEETKFELQSSRMALPAPLNENKMGIFISGRNLSDDLFMYVTKQLTGLEPNTTYTAKFIIDVASNAPSNAVGVGGAPGESVFLGIGVTATEPQKVVEGEMYRMNIDKGNQASEGSSRKVIGHIANGTNGSNYVLLNKLGEFTFTTNNNGTAWAMVSTDSGFEATTALYYDRISIAIFRN